MSIPTPTPVSVVNLKKILQLSSNATNGYLQQNLIGSGHQGPEIMSRVMMSLKSGISSEIEWALGYLTHLSCSDSHLIDFEKTPYLGEELIKYFIRPFQRILEKGEVDLGDLSLSLNSLLSLRNLAQDLSNQQWLSQVKSLKKNLVEVLKFFINWFYKGGCNTYKLQKYNDLFKEGFTYLVDLIEPLSCYYIDNTKSDPLFTQLLGASVLTNDKNLLINILTSLSHLLIIKDRSKSRDDDNEPGIQEEEEIKLAPNNCIDAISDLHLQHFVNFLLINDNDLVYAVLDFLKQYLNSEALHSQFPNSIRDSKLFRLRKLLQLKDSKENFHTLMKQLPILIVSGLPLNDPTKIPAVPALNLTRRSQFSGVPSTLPELPKQLYDIIVKFPEPLRATTWLRCCYEPYHSNYGGEVSGVVPGEVTQISLWKAYEKQFEEIWQTSKTQPNPEWPQLLPAVDFIKNVNAAFPNSEAMVVNLESDSTDQAPKKKFIIRGIQPRQFVVSIDEGNYQALKQQNSNELSENHQSLPIEHIDSEKFNHFLKNLSNSLLIQGRQVSKGLKEINPINTISSELLDYIIIEIFESFDESDELKGIFKVYNGNWLSELVYTNPGLLESNLIREYWLRYFI